MQAYHEYLKEQGIVGDHLNDIIIIDDVVEELPVVEEIEVNLPEEIKEEIREEKRLSYVEYRDLLFKARQQEIEVFWNTIHKLQSAATNRTIGTI